MSNMQLYNGKNIQTNSVVDDSNNSSLNESNNMLERNNLPMKNDNYVTHDELKISQLETQNKIDKLDSKIDNLSEKIDEKFNSIPMMIENALYKEREYQREQQKETRRFFWGTIIIGGISAISAIISIVISLL